MIRFAVGRWAVQLDRCGLVVLDRVEHRARRRRERIRGRSLAFASVDDAGPGFPPAAGGSAGAVAHLPGLAAALAAQPRRDEPVGFSVAHLRHAHELGRRGRPLRG